MRKRAIAPMELVIGLVILLVLAVVLIAVLSGKTQYFIKSTTCEGQGNSCVVSVEECGKTPINLECKDSAKQICCPKG